MCAADWLTVFHFVFVRRFRAVEESLFVFWRLTFGVPSLVSFVR